MVDPLGLLRHLLLTFIANPPPVLDLLHFSPLPQLFGSISIRFLPDLIGAMELQPEDVRVPSEESSPTHVPPDDLPPQQEQLDPALLSSIPRSENQYNEDFTDYARQVHNSTHGDWPVAEPYEEWTCRRSHTQRYWFYRAWFHHKTLPWDHDDIAFYKSATGYFIDDHPASHWPHTFSRIWGTRGWQLVLSATQSFDIWTQCERYDAALRIEEERIAAEEARFSSTQQLEDNPVPRRGLKRQAVDNLEHLNVQYQVEALLHNFQHLDVSRFQCSRAYPPRNKNSLSLVSSTPSLLTAMSFINLFDQMIHLAIPSRPLRLLLTTFLTLIPFVMAPDFRFLYPIQHLCH